MEISWFINRKHNILGISDVSSILYFNIKFLVSREIKVTRILG